MNTRRASESSGAAAAGSSRAARPSRLRETANYEEVPSDVDMEDDEFRSEDEDEEDIEAEQASVGNPDDGDVREDEGEPEEEYDDEEEEEVDDEDGTQDGLDIGTATSSRIQTPTPAAVKAAPNSSPIKSVRSSRRGDDDDDGSLSELSEEAGDDEEDEEEEDEEEEDEEDDVEADELASDDGEPEDEEDEDMEEEGRGAPSALTGGNGSKSLRIKLKVSPSTSKPKFKPSSSKSKSNKRRRRDELDGSEDEDFVNVDLSASLPKTARQLAKSSRAEGSSFGLEELPAGASKSKFKGLSESEIALKRSEMSRRRKNQSDQKLEEEKTETINRLLKKQVSRSRNKLAGGEGSGDEGGDGTPTSAGAGPAAGGVAGLLKLSRKEIKEQPTPFLRYISNGEGATLSLPIEEAGKGVYAEAWEHMFAQRSPQRRKLVEEIGQS
ncbi:hypothetical protein K437DRAFT_259900 [Tilletiaria anomala UBC 951]|uniref:INO80 complex subunit B-like conserved region domain-containing protein n=1 Tax=Tilletiaria anomala (strain ATCC 24038 / CBS 436.72 / UBC 951) TaxID=1037660 RepID=A0A066VEL5_TILAU|nr:uncharacterized protein K437DRAFT_259900 [Tilletiaria anomala UBC 951]KDN37204.1 hypothetical protein K437DRAFT_259900 [Tilletiaria anomala UBC 951]